MQEKWLIKYVTRYDLLFLSIAGHKPDFIFDFQRLVCMAIYKLK